jgi:hypothetical protein
LKPKSLRIWKDGTHNQAIGMMAKSGYSSPLQLRQIQVKTIPALINAILTAPILLGSE